MFVLAQNFQRGRFRKAAHPPGPGFEDLKSTAAGPRRGSPTRKKCGRHHHDQRSRRSSTTLHSCRHPHQQQQCRSQSPSTTPYSSVTRFSESSPFQHSHSHSHSQTRTDSAWLAFQQRRLHLLWRVCIRHRLRPCHHSMVGRTQQGRESRFSSATHHSTTDAAATDAYASMFILFHSQTPTEAVEGHPWKGTLHSTTTLAHLYRSDADADLLFFPAPTVPRGLRVDSYLPMPTVPFVAARTGLACM